MKSNGSTVRDFVIQNFLYGEDGRLEEDTSFLGNSIIDSTGILELVTFLEETYGITVDDDEIIPANLDSLKNIDDYITRKLNRPSRENAVPIEYPEYPENRAGFEHNQQGVIASDQQIL